MNAPENFRPSSATLRSVPIHRNPRCDVRLGTRRIFPFPTSLHCVSRLHIVMHAARENVHTSCDTILFFLLFCLSVSFAFVTWYPYRTKLLRACTCRLKFISAESNISLRRTVSCARAADIFEIAQKRTFHSRLIRSTLFPLLKEISITCDAIRKKSQSQSRCIHFLPRVSFGESSPIVSFIIRLFYIKCLFCVFSKSDTCCGRELVGQVTIFIEHRASVALHLCYNFLLNVNSI